MSDKNRVITNGLFRKKMAELMGEDIVNAPQFNDFQALDVSTFTREVDKLIDNPPWSGGGSGGESDVEVIIFEGTQEDQGVATITCEKTPAQVEEITKPISAYLTLEGSALMPLERTGTTEFVINIIMEDINAIGQVTVYAEIGVSGSEWRCSQTLIPLGGGSDPTVYNANVTTADGQTFTVSEFKDFENNNVTLSAILTALGITIDDGRYVRPVELKDVVVNVSVDGTGTAAQGVNAIGKFHFTAADGISQTVNFSGAFSIAAPDGTGGFVSTPVLMNLRVGDNSGTPVYTFEQTYIT